MKPNWIFPLVACGAMVAYAGETRTWSQYDYAEFEKGVIRNLSVRSDGLLKLAPRSREVLDASAAYLWALAVDSKGTLYAGGGPGAKLHRIAAGGRHKVVAELEGLEIHALAVDSKDRVYAATSPDGKVYRITGDTRPEVFYDPKAKYIWALQFDRQGNLYVATGGRGEVHRVAPDGNGRLFFKTEETHARSLAMDPSGNLIVGTDPGGLVIRVSPSGEGFVVYQMAKKEVTAVTVGPDGMIYAAGVGIKGMVPPPTPVPAPPQPAAAPAAPALTSGTQARTAAPQPAAPAAPPPPPVVTGGSEVYRIDATGFPLRLWSNSQDVVYSLAPAPSGGVLAGAGNKGAVYHIESETRYTALLNLAATQITALVPGLGGRLYAATGNAGRVYEIGPGLEPEGSLESDVFDAGMFSTWGRLSFEGRINGGRVSIAARSGNLDQPQKGWSPWSGEITETAGARVTCPPSRFAQWKAVLRAAPGGASPEVESVTLAYLPRNVAPRVQETEMTPANYRFPTPVLSTGVSQTLSLPPLGKRKAPETPPVALEGMSSSSMQYAKGYVGIRWNATDPNGDALTYKLEIRGVGEKEWKPLKDQVREKYYSWDSTRYADGEYVVRVTVSDALSNPPAEALTGQAESDVFIIDNTPPRITGLEGKRLGNRLEIRWHAADQLNNIGKAEYSLDGGDWTVVAPLGKLSDSKALDYLLSIENATPGEHTVAVRVQDDYDNRAIEQVVVR